MSSLKSKQTSVNDLVSDVDRIRDVLANTASCKSLTDLHVNLDDATHRLRRLIKEVAALRKWGSL